MEKRNRGIMVFQERARYQHQKLASARPLIILMVDISERSEIFFIFLRGGVIKALRIQNGKDATEELTEDTASKRGAHK